jgi:hypothetical protein
MIFRRWVTGTSFLCDPPYLTSCSQRPAARTRSVRRASGFVLTGNSEVVLLDKKTFIPRNCARHPLPSGNRRTLCEWRGGCLPAQAPGLSVPLHVSSSPRKCRNSRGRRSPRPYETRQVWLGRKPSRTARPAATATWRAPKLRLTWQPSLPRAVSRRASQCRNRHGFC